MTWAISRYALYLEDFDVLFMDELFHSLHVRRCFNVKSEQFEFPRGDLEGVALLLAVEDFDFPPLLRWFGGFRRSCLECCLLLMILWYLKAICRGISSNGRRQVRPQLSIGEARSPRCVSGRRRQRLRRGLL